MNRLAWRDPEQEEPLGVLLLPDRLEQFALEAHARALLEIPRVVALEPSRFHPPRFMRDASAMRQARRLRFPGRPRLVVLYHPAQYPLARALCAHEAQAELWYVPPPADDVADEELQGFDDRARERAAQIPERDGAGVDDQALRARLRELGVISSRPFAPDARARRRAG